MKVPKNPQKKYLSSLSDGGNTINEHMIKTAKEIPPNDIASNNNLNKAINSPIFIISDYYLKLKI